MNTSADQPYLDCAYKLQEYQGRARRKRSEGKATWPGRKQVWRTRGDDGCMAGDMLTVEGDPQGDEPVLQAVMRGGRRLVPSPALAAVCEHARRQLAALPAALKCLDAAAVYPVVVAPALRDLAQRVDASG